MGIGAAIAGSALLSGGAGIFGSIMGGNAETDAAKQAMQAEERMFGIAQGDLQPFMQFGTQAGNQLMEMLGIGGNSGAKDYGSLMKSFNPTMQQLEQTPGYQFAKTQGLEATQNGFAARGLGASGNAMRGGANYAEGLASTTYQQQFEDYLQQNQNKFNMLAGPMQMGEGAAAGMAGNAMNLGGMLGQNHMAIGNAQAGMYSGIASGISQMGQAPFAGMMGQAQMGYMNALTQNMGSGGGYGGGYNQMGLWGGPWGVGFGSDGG